MLATLSNGKTAADAVGGGYEVKVSTYGRARYSGRSGPTQVAAIGNAPLSGICGVVRLLV